MPIVCHTATVLCPMTGPPVAGGGVLVDDARVVAVGDAARLRRDADRVVHHDGVLLPAFVDARTQAELWDAGVEGIPRQRHEVEGPTARWDAERWGRSARRGVHAEVRAGVAATGDVVWRGPAVPASCRAGLVGDSWLALAGVDRSEQDAVLAAAARSLRLPAAGRRVGLAPHPLALGTGVLQAVAALAERERAPLHVVVRGDAAEREALGAARGPLVDAARAHGFSFEWLEDPAGQDSIAYLDALGLLGPRTSVAPLVALSAADARLLARRRTTLVWGAEGDPHANDPAPGGDQHGEPTPAGPGGRGALLAHLAEAGAAVALAGGVDRDVLATASAWVAAARAAGLGSWPAPSGPIPLPEAALRLATVDGAAAMGWGGAAGVLAAGRRADFTVVDLVTTAERVYEDLVAAGPGRQVATVLAGVHRARRASADVPWPDVEVDVALGLEADPGAGQPGQAPPPHPGAAR